MGLLTRSADLVYTFRFLKLLVTPFDKTKAFDLGIVDAEGKRDKSVKLDTPEKKSAYTTFHRLVYNIKRLMAKAPGGSSKIASYAAALLLIKEHGNLSDKGMEKIIEELGIDVLQMVDESSSWLTLEDQTIAPGMYRIACEKIVNSTAEQIVNKKDQVRIIENGDPYDYICGVPVYQARHVNSGQMIYVTAAELLR